MPKTTSEQNKAVVLKAFDTLFNDMPWLVDHLRTIPHCTHIGSPFSHVNPGLRR